MTRTRKAFTLVELLIAVTIMGILASVVISAATSDGTQSLEATARVLGTDLQLARSLAIQHDTEWTVEFDTVSHQYELVHTGSGTPPAPVNPLAGAGEAAGRYVVVLQRLGTTTVGDNGVRLSGAALKTSRTRVTDVTFGPLGGTGPARNEETVVWLTDSNGISTRYIRLTISWVTGQVWIDPPGMFKSADQIFE
jgi:prepilin-type N-terminal cleavage/methylation domain-containing protein